jgi:hypothetical protein
MEYIKIKNEKYVEAKNLINLAPIYCKGIRTGRSFVKKNNIDQHNYIFAKLYNEKWELSDGKSMKFDKLFICKTYVDTNKKLTDEINGVKVVDNHGIEQAPDIIVLNDNEKFTDNNGNVLNIETRGEKKEDMIYFNVNDVSTEFGIPRLRSVVVDKNKSYNELIDYKYFTCLYDTKSVSVKKNITNNKIKSSKELFLTYSGILRVLFVSRNKNVNDFRKWATTQLFTIQMGTVEDKKNLSDKLLGSNAKICIDVMKRSSSKITCVYLFSLGYVKDLKKSMKLDDTYTDQDIVCKFGLTNDLERRTKEHILEYGSIANVDLKLMNYCYIDHKFIQDAENNLKSYFSQWKLTYNNYQELVVINEKIIKSVNDQYKLINKGYIGDYKEIEHKLQYLEMQLENEKEKVIHEKEKNELMKQLIVALQK